MPRAERIGSKPVNRRRFHQARRAATGAIIAATLFGCATISQWTQPSPQERAQSLEPLLSAAGFRMLPADTPQKLDQIKNLPQLSVKYYTNKEGKSRYWMADADICHCLYIGDEAAYQKYQDLRLQEHLAEEQREAAEEQMEASQQMQMEMMFGPPGFIFP